MLCHPPKKGWMRKQKLDAIKSTFTSFNSSLNWPIKDGMTLVIQHLGDSEKHVLNSEQVFLGRKCGLSTALVCVGLALQGRQIERCSNKGRLELARK